MPRTEDLTTVQKRFLDGVGSLIAPDKLPDPAPSVDAADLTLSAVAGLYTVASRFHRIEFIFDRLQEARGGVHAELQVNAGWKDDLLGITDISLKSESSREKIAKALKAHDQDTPWRPLLEQGCAKVLRHHRTGDPLVTISSETPIEPLTFALNPLVFDRKVSVLYSNGGQGKSTLALFLAMLSASGSSEAGFSALKGNSLYLDFEDDLSVHARRLHAIQNGHPALRSARVAYRRCVEPLHKFAPALLQQIHQEQIRFVVVDSLLAATGGDASAEATTQLFIAL
ncbi:MAG TPA: AAA family ATPase, partial [Nitrospira sp.]|nr:AAA family ATPase [Nitrospira sp.]